MISSVRGEVIAIGLDHAVVEVGGVGLAVQATPNTLATLRRGQQARLATAPARGRTGRLHSGQGLAPRARSLAPTSGERQFITCPVCGRKSLKRKRKTGCGAGGDELVADGVAHEIMDERSMVESHLRFRRMNIDVHFFRVAIEKKQREWIARRRHQVVIGCR